jgi:hypothetical protein
MAFPKIRGDIIQNAKCYLGLHQYIFTVHNRNLDDLVVFVKFDDVIIAISYFELVVPDTILHCALTSIYRVIQKKYTLPKNYFPKTTDSKSMSCVRIETKSLKVLMSMI